MIPGLLGLNVTVTLPFLPVLTVFEMPAPVILTVAPDTGFLPFVTFTTTFCALPVACSTLAAMVRVSQISAGCCCGFGVGGFTVAVTIGEPDAVLLFGFLSTGVVL